MDYDQITSQVTVAAIILFVFRVILLYLSWNYIAPVVFNLPEITINQATVITAVIIWVF